MSKKYSKKGKWYNVTPRLEIMKMKACFMIADDEQVILVNNNEVGALISALNGIANDGYTSPKEWRKANGKS
jgi:hypothetical protein